jgi:quinol monooxygenase YgiN
MPNNDLVFYVQLHVKPEYVQDWKDAVMEVIDRMSKETTFVSCYLHQDTEDANRFITHSEFWANV